ncbi:uncharacterized protein [Apostichopus japonicus]|uniref:uncharacterized protein n=1 Tax=Stichopus japonicus TaxID=307972 RepID=UPI003AB79A11
MIYSDKHSMAEIYLDSEDANTILDHEFQEEEDEEISSFYMCICKDATKTDDFVYCYGENCKIEWFHTGCVGLDTGVGLEEQFAAGDKWFCDNYNLDKSGQGTLVSGTPEPPESAPSSSSTSTKGKANSQKEKEVLHQMSLTIH